MSKKHPSSHPLEAFAAVQPLPLHTLWKLFGRRKFAQKSLPAFRDPDLAWQPEQACQPLEIRIWHGSQSTNVQDVSKEGSLPSWTLPLCM
jgi:hypothetical protein